MPVHVSFVRRRDPHELSAVGTPHGIAYRHLVAFGDDIFHGDSVVREGGTKGSNKLFDALCSLDVGSPRRMAYIRRRE